MTDINSLLSRLRKAAEHLPLYEWDHAPRFGSGLSDVECEAIQKIANTDLPDDFLTFLKYCGEISGMTVHNGYAIGGPPLPRDESIMTIKPQGRSLRAIIVAQDGGGNAFLMCLGVRNSIWKWNHETDELQWIADSFIELLERVAVDWEKYIENDYGHEYISG
jgi:hypothetical protein